MKHIEKWLIENGYIIVGGVPPTYQKSNGGCSKMVWIIKRPREYQISIIEVLPNVTKRKFITTHNYKEVIKFIKK